MYLSKYVIVLSLLSAPLVASFKIDEKNWVIQKIHDNKDDLSKEMTEHFAFCICIAILREINKGETIQNAVKKGYASIFPQRSYSKEDQETLDRLMKELDAITY